MPISRFRAIVAVVALAATGCAGGAKLPSYELQPPEVIERVDDGYAPWIKIHSGTFSVERPRLNAVWFVGAQKHKTTGQEQYFVHLSIIYTANEPHSDYKATLAGGRQLKIAAPERTVSSCLGASKTCVYNDQMVIELPQATLKEYVRNDLTFEFQSKGSQAQSFSVPAIVIANLIDRARRENFEI